MIAQSMVWLAATAALLALAARALEEVVRSYGGATRWVWVGALCGSAALPLAALATDGAFPGSLLRGGAPVELAALLASADAPTLTAVAPTSDASARGALTDRTLATVWLAASALALALYVATWLRLARSRRRWRAGHIDDTPVLVTARGGPAVLGLIRPSIVVPEWLRSESAAAQRMVLLHEREHVRAGDHALLAVAPLFAIAMPWNPALWWQLRRLRLAIEVDCDRRVLARGIEPGVYGRLLLDIARRGGRAPMGAAALAEPRTFLERRILAMSSTIPRLRLPRAIALSVASAVFALAACEATMPMNAGTPEPRPPEPETIAASPEQPLEVAAERAIGDPLIIIDGVIVEMKLDELTDPNTIDRIEVIKGEAAARLYGPRGANGVIQIFTKQAAGEVERRVLVEERAATLMRAREVPVRVRVVPPEEERRMVVEGTVLTELERRNVVEATVRAEVERRMVLEEARENAGVIHLRERSPVRALAPSPVILIDGVIMPEADLRRIPPESIERIEVVKGAAAAALGVSGGRGLIMITTKK